MPVQDNEIPKTEKQVFENERDKLKQEDIIQKPQKLLPFLNAKWFCQYHLTHFIRTRIMQRERYDHSRAFFGLPEADHRWRCRFFCWPSNS